MIVDQGKKGLNLVPLGTFAYFIRLLVPCNVSHIFEFREMIVKEFAFKNVWLDIS